MSLIQLPNGDWLDVWNFAGIRAAPDREYPSTGVMLIVQANGFTHYCKYSTVKEAETLRDVYAKRVNEARLVSLPPNKSRIETK